MKNKKYIEQAFEYSYGKVCDLEQRIAALHYAAKPVRNKHLNTKGESKANVDFGNLHSELYNQLNEAYRNVFMFGVVSYDKKLIVRAKKLAFEHYLKEKCEIMSYLDFHGSYPCDLETQFKKELKFLEEKN